VPTITVEVRTDENGYFSKTVPFSATNASGTRVALSVTLLSPFATGVWGTMEVDERDGAPSHQAKTFVVWHSELVQLGSWSLASDNSILVVRGKTRPVREGARVLLLIDIDQ
jgi:hypothetical protein